jgi:hypothetical protein
VRPLTWPHVLAGCGNAPMSGIISKEKIEQLAPDQASLASALKLLKPAAWPVLARDTSTDLLWGECQGSGSMPYRAVVAASDLGYKCTCPSRKFPCKHSLALMWMISEQPHRFAEASIPDWVNDWLARRRPKSAAGGTAKPGEPARPSSSGEGASIAAALSQEEAAATPDPKAAARAEAQRARLKEEREASILAGLDELDRWISDHLVRGLAGFPAIASQSCRTMSARLIDAKAPGLAALVDELGTKLFRLPDAERGDFAISQLGNLVLLSSAYRRQHLLPPSLQADVRRIVGWTLRREEVLEDPSALRVRSRWLVAANRSEAEPGKIRRLETWLLRIGTVSQLSTADVPDFALLFDFVPLAGGSASFPFAQGEVIDAEVVYYPSAAPLRALVAGRQPTVEGMVWPEARDELGEALARRESAVASNPFVNGWPISAGNVEIATADGGRLFVTTGENLALPLDQSQTDRALPLLGLGAIDVAGLWDGRIFSLYAANTPIGLWQSE